MSNVTYALPLTLTDEDIRRFYAKLAPVRPDGCRYWTRSLDAGGYGQFSLRPRTVKAHLVAWHLERGPFPPELEPDHLCTVRHCTAVEHLEWVTHAENARRVAMRMTYCRAGLHRWDEQVPLRYGERRRCRLCVNSSKRTRYALTGRR
jgi:HNH endonuclease